MKFTRTILPVLAAFSLNFAASALADDNENTKTEDTTKNPVTGTVTETKKEEVKTTNADGSTTKKKVKKVKKKKTDGSTENKTETETSTDKK